MNTRGFLRRLAFFSSFIECLEDRWAARQAKLALEEWESDPWTARPWRECLAELGICVRDDM